MSQTLLFQSFFKLQLGLRAVFSRGSNQAGVSLTPSKEAYTEHGPASVFMNMEPALFLLLIEQNVNPKLWADGKTGLNTKCCSCCYQAQNPALIFTSKAVSTKA